MRNSRLLFLVFLLVCHVQARAESPAYGFREDPSETLLPAASYRLTLIRAEPDGNHGSMGIFEFRHSMEGPLRLWGFGFEPDGSLRVRFERFARLREGRWNEVMVGYCGTGAETYEVLPGYAYLLRVPLWPFLTEGTRGVVRLSAEKFTVTSEEFATEPVRKVAVVRGRAK